MSPYRQQKDDLLWDPKQAPPKVTMDIRPIEEQDEYESRRFGLPTFRLLGVLTLESFALSLSLSS